VQKCHPTPGILDIGRYPGDTDDVAGQVAADLRRAGFESVPRPDIMAWKHRKLLMNLGNAVDATCADSDAADNLAQRAYDEGERVLTAAGVSVVSEADDRERRGEILCRRTDSVTPAGGSTWQSVSRGARGVEVDFLSGEIVLLGRLHGVATPVNALLQRVTQDLARSGGRPRSLDAAALLATLPPDV